jgi:hypothetical protein
MATPRVGILPSADRQAIFDAARKLNLNPYEFGAFLSLEAGTNMDPNIQGGAGGRHYGLIQFGPGEQQKYLDPNKKGKYTRAEQIFVISKTGATSQEWELNVLMQPYLAVTQTYL